MVAIRPARGDGDLARCVELNNAVWTHDPGCRPSREAGRATGAPLNEVRNAPIQKLNRRFGYRPGPGRIRVRGPLET